MGGRVVVAVVVEVLCVGGMADVAGVAGADGVADDHIVYWLFFQPIVEEHCNEGRHTHIQAYTPKTSTPTNPKQASRDRC